MEQHIIMILTIAVGAHPLPSYFPLLYSNAHVLCFVVLALAAFLALHFFHKCVSTQRVPPTYVLPYRYLPSYSNRLSPVNGFPSAILWLGPLLMVHYWLRRLWPTSRNPEVVYITFPSYRLQLLNYPSLAKYFRTVELVIRYPSQYLTGPHGRNILKDATDIGIGHSLSVHGLHGTTG